LPQQNVVTREDGGEPPLFPYGFGLRYSDNGDLEMLSEEIGSIAALTADTQQYFTRGRLGSGWSWVTGNENEIKPLAQGVTRIDEGPVQISPVDRAAQEDARLLRFSGTGTARAGIAGEVPIDLRRESNGQLALTFDYRVDEAPSADVSLSIECGPGCTGSIPITKALAGSTIKQWQQLKIPLSCFEKAGTDMSRVTGPLLITTKGRLSLAITEARLESNTGGVNTCPSW
jgi:beta-glucosidase